MKFILKVRSHFGLKFLNRLDGIVFFQPLYLNQLLSIIRSQFQSIEERFKGQYITITLTEKAIQLILKRSYHPRKITYIYLISFILLFNIVNGVQPLKHYVEQCTTNILRELIRIKLQPHCRVIIDADENDQYQIKIELSKGTTSET